jgi:hypothetical protein
VKNTSEREEHIDRHLFPLKGPEGERPEAVVRSIGCGAHRGQRERNVRELGPTQIAVDEEIDEQPCERGRVGSVRQRRDDHAASFPASRRHRSTVIDHWTDVSECPGDSRAGDNLSLIEDVVQEAVMEADTLPRGEVHPEVAHWHKAATIRLAGTSSRLFSTDRGHPSNPEPP